MKYDHFILGLLKSGQWSGAVGRRNLVPGALLAGSLIAVSTLLAGCSEVPDAVNPVSWYKGVEGWFSDEDETPPETVKTASETKKATTQTAQNEAAQGGEQTFPTLQEVPEKPITSTVEERRKIMEGLSADREHAQYADESARAAAPAAAPPASGGAAPAKSAATGPESTAAAPMTKPQAPASMAESNAAPPVAGAPPPVPPSSATGEKKYLSGLDTGPEPAPPPAPAEEAVPSAAPTTPEEPMAPRAKAEAPTPPAPPAPPARAQAVTPPALGSSELDRVYSQKLKESAPTVTTAPAGPTAGGPPPPAHAVAEPPATPEMPASSPGVLQARTSGALPPTTVVGESSGPSVQVFDGALSGMPGQVGTVYFGSGSAHLDQNDLAKLRQIVAVYKQRGGNIRVVGHASSFTRDMDPVHHQMVNFTISVRRADAVAHELIKLGVKPENLLVSAQSDSDPVYYESMPAGRAGNQRAEIFIDY